jgi:hypothetical protein
MKILTKNRLTSQFFKNFQSFSENFENFSDNFENFPKTFLHPPPIFRTSGHPWAFASAESRAILFPIRLSEDY